MKPSSPSLLAVLTVLSTISLWGSTNVYAYQSDRRRLVSSSLGHPSTPEEYKGKLCPGGAAGKALYQVYVHVMANSHLTLVAALTNKEDHEDADYASCPDMAFHSGSTGKEMIVLKEDLLKQEEEDMDKDSLHLLGEYTGTELMEAFEQVPSKTNNEDDRSTNMAYDIVTHNCGSFVLDMLCYLGYAPSMDDLTWTIQRLLMIQEASDNVMDAISKSPHANDLPTVVATADDPQDASSLQGHSHQVVADLVYYYAANHQGTCFTNKHPQDATTTTDNNNNNKYVIALVVENVVWFMIAAGCFWMGLRLHNKNNNNDEDDHKMNNKNTVLT